MTLTTKEIVFCNSRNKAGHFGMELERKLNEARKKFDVITGTLNTNKKFWRMRLLCGNEEEEEFVGEFSFCAKVFANACNVGVDDSRINYYTMYAFLAISTHTFKRMDMGRDDLVLNLDSTSMWN